MANMSPQRQGEIALMLIRKRLAEKGIPVLEFRREAGNMAKKIGITSEEMRNFIQTLLPELIGDMLGFNKVGITCEEPKG